MIRSYVATFEIVLFFTLDKSRDTVLQHGISDTAFEEQWESNSALRVDKLETSLLRKWPLNVRVRGGFGPQGCPCPIALATPVAARAQCALTRTPGVQCFLQHIGASGFRVKWALWQEAVQLGWVVLWRMRGSRPLPLPRPYGSCSDGTRL